MEKELIRRAFYCTQTLAEAVLTGSVNRVNYMLTHETPNDLKQFNLDIALVSAASKGFYPIVCVLVEKGARCHAGECVVNPLIIAANGGYLNVVQFLAENGGAADVLKNDAFLQAVLAGRGQVVSYILGIHGSSMQTQLNSAMESALDWGLDGMASFLLENGAIIRDKNNALRRAAEDGYLGVVQFLVGSPCGANVNAPVGYPQPIELAAKRGHTQVVHYLLDNGANIHAGKDYALYKAVRRGNLEETKFLVKRGAYVDAKDVLCAAVENQRLDMVEYLMEQKEYTVRDKTKALVCAAEMGSLPICEFLVGKGANAHRAGKHAFDCAMKNQHVQVANYLAQHLLVVFHPRGVL